MFLLLYLLLSAAGTLACPPHLGDVCNCTVTPLHTLYECAMEDVSFVMEAAVNDFARISCKGGRLTCNFPNFPVSLNDETLDLLTLKACSLPQLSCIARALGARGVRRLHLESAREQLGTTQLEGLYGLEILTFIAADRQTTLPLDAFTAAPSLEDVRFSTSKIRLNSSASWPSNHQLRYLELVDDEVDLLQRGAFSSLKNLTRLTLSSNKIEVIGPMAFEGLDNLQSLEIDNNLLLKLPPGAFTGAPRLQNLTFSSHHLELVETGALESLQHLEKIKIFIGQPNQRLKLEPGAFSELPSLRELDISETLLAPLPEDLLVHSAKLQSITLTDCGLEELPEKLFQDQTELVALDLSGNAMRALHAAQFWPLRRLQQLHLARNQLAALPPAVFSGLKSLRRLQLQHNRLARVPPGSFHGLALTSLDASHNLLTLQGDTQAFSSLYGSLQELDLSGNRVGLVPGEWRANFIYDIRRINLASNRIRALQAKDLQFVAKNITVDFQHNEITTVELPADIANTGATFLLDHNPFTCDCDLYHFLKFTRNNQLIFKMEDAVCNYPPKMLNKSLNDIALASLTCKVKDNCPEHCNCSKSPATMELNLDCSEVPTIESYPKPEYHNLTKSMLKLRNLDKALNLPDYLTSLDLSNLSLSEVPMFPETVKEVDLRSNKMIIPDWLLARNVTLYVPQTLKCNCGHQNDLRNLIGNQNKIMNFYSLVCEDGRLLDKINVESICDVWYTFVVGGSIGLVALIIVVIYCCRKTIKKFLYHRGCNCFFYEEEIDNKCYDALISYPDSYEKFVVENLVPFLEKEGYLVAVRYRDWDVGDYIPDKVADLVTKSRRIVILLAQDYVDSLSSLELDAALECEKKDRRRRVVNVVTEEFNSDEKLEDLLAGKKYIRLQEDFWMKLKKNLPRKRERRVGSRPSQRMLNVMMTSQGNVRFSPRKPLDKV